MPSATIASRASPQKSRAVSAHSASSIVGSAFLLGFQSTSALHASQSVRMRSRQPGSSNPGLDQVPFDARREILAPHYAHTSGEAPRHGREEDRVKSGGPAAMPEPFNRPSFSRSISYLSTFRFLRASVSHTGSACRMPFRVTGGRSPGGLLAGRWTRMDLDSVGFDVPRERQLLVEYLGASQPRSRTTTLWSTPSGSSSP